MLRSVALALAVALPVAAATPLTHHGAPGSLSPSPPASRGERAVDWLPTASSTAPSTAIPTATPPSTAIPTPPPTLSLPDGVRPLREALDLDLDPAQERYRGTARIDLELASPSTVVWLNAQDLDIASARVESEGSGQPARVSAGAPGFVSLTVDRPIGPGRASVSLAFGGAIDRLRSRGLYAVTAGDAWFAHTFFEPLGARRAFPCLDEPRFRIPWRVSLRVPRGQGAFSNAPAESTRSDGDGTRVVFAETRPLPSYLVALAAGPFEVVEAGAVGKAGAPLRFLVPPGRGAETRAAAAVVPRIVEALEAWTGIPFPFEKLDVVAVPRDGGSMEHPGLLALGEDQLLLRPEDETPERRYDAANLAAHELAHYWFGDLVTMAGWDDTWLSEGFASWIDAPLTDGLDPQWSGLVARRAADRREAMEADALPSAKRLREPVRSRHDVEGAFDTALTYQKGASVLAMLEAWLGAGRWRAAVRRYLEAHAWGAATAEDLYAALAAEAGPDAAAALRSFAEQPGFPRITLEARCTGGRGTLRVAQEPVGPGGPRTWTVPVCVRWGAGTREERTCAVLAAPRAEVPLAACPRWIVPNAGGTGYYLSQLRVRDLPPALERADTPEDRALVADALLAVRSGDAPAAEVLALAPALARDGDRLHEEASLEVAALARARELDEPGRVRWSRFVLATWGVRGRALGLLPRPGEPEEDAALRVELVPFVAEEGRESGLTGEATALARRWLVDRRALPLDVAARVLAVAARSGDRALFERTLAVARGSADEREREVALDALGRFHDPGWVREALLLVLDPALELRDAMQVARSALSTREGRDPAWELLRTRFADVAGRLRDDEVGALVSLLGDAFCDGARRAEIAAVLGPEVEAFDGAPRALARALDRIDACAAGLRRDGPAVARFLGKY